MDDYESLFRLKSIKYCPKNSLPILKRINRFSNNSFENLKFSLLNYEYLDQKSFMLQVSNGSSVESFFFSIYKDSTGYFLRDNRIRHFHSYENALKYKLAKIYDSNYRSEQSIEYYCYNLDSISDGSDEYDYISDSYRRGQRIFIV